MTRLNVNGRTVEVEAESATPLLWVLREHLGLVGTRFGCGAGMCGACTVHIDGVARFACQIQLGEIGASAVTTIEGLSEEGEHPVQKAWVAEQAPQCGYCQSGQIMRAAALLAENPSPSRQEIIDGMSTSICRCGTYPRIIRAVARAAREG